MREKRKRSAPSVGLEPRLFLALLDEFCNLAQADGLPSQTALARGELLAKRVCCCTFCPGLMTNSHNSGRSPKQERPIPPRHTHSLFRPNRTPIFGPFRGEQTMLGMDGEWGRCRASFSMGSSMLGVSIFRASLLANLLMGFGIRAWYSVKA